jgi:hypothetical protein
MKRIGSEGGLPIKDGSENSRPSETPAQHSRSATFRIAILFTTGWEPPEETA